MLSGTREVEGLVECPRREYLAGRLALRGGWLERAGQCRVQWWPRDGEGHRYR